MALQKNSLTINFAQGVNTKTDPLQVPPGQFLNLENSVFNKGGLLTKRNGYGLLTNLPTSDTRLVTTFNGNLTAIGNNLNAYNMSAKTWVNKGNLPPVQLSTIPLIRSATNQTANDAAVAPNGLVCTVFTDTIPNNTGGATFAYKYAVADSVTGQNIIAPTVIVPSSGTVTGSSKVFVLGKYFVIVFTTEISSTFHLQYIAIGWTNTSLIVAATNISSQYTPSSSVAFDGAVANNNLYLAWNGSDGGGAIRITYITQYLSQANTVTYATYSATIVSTCVDVATNNPLLYVSFYNSGSSTGYTLATDLSLTPVFAPQQIIATGTITNLASSAQNGSALVLYETYNTYSYNSAQTDFVSKISVSSAGAVGSPSVLDRGVGLASKAFIVSGTQYVMIVYGSNTQPTYFIVNMQGQVIAKLAYSNGGGYLPTGLPSVTVTKTVAQLSYLYADLIQAVNKSQGIANSSGIYSQTGINLATFTFAISDIATAEIGNDLHIGGGFLWMYDGYLPVEHLFHLWPDNVVLSQVADVMPTGNVANMSKTISAISSMTGIAPGQNISGTGIPANTIIISVNVGGSSITISNAATATNSGVTLTITGNVTAQQYFGVATYEWADNQGNVFRSAGSIPATVTTTSGHSSILWNVPTLRLTYKLANPVKIVLYRWSVAQQIYYQTTSIQNPIINDTTVDSIAFVDTNSDAQILGNNILYTTGGVVENIAAPATNILTLFKSRLFLVDAEDKNLLWYSKQVIENTPVETSDLFTLYIAPTTAAQGSTGPITALSAMDDKLIIFKKDAIYYITGTGPDNTGAGNDFSEPIFITSTVGCTNQQSIVFMPEGLMFQSDKGIWLLGRDLSSQYIGAPVESFTQSALVQSAVNVPGTNQVRFTLSSGITLMYDYYYAQWGTFTNVPAISSALYEGLHTYANSFGQVFQESPGTYIDGSFPVLMHFTTSWYSLMGLQGLERAYYFYLLGTYLSPHKLNIQIAYDYDPTLTQSTVISPDNYNAPWGGDPFWGSSTPWGGASNIEQWRVFIQRQKCQSFQITLDEIYDASFGVAAGAGVALSGINLVVGGKKKYPTLKPSSSVG